MSGVHFNEDWFCEASQFWLAQLFRTVRRLDGDVIEVGSWEGRSTLALANAVWPEMVHAVDTWEGALTEPSQLEIVKHRDVYQRFVDNVAAGTRGNVTPHRMSWEDFRWNRKIKFLHIDGEHTYEAVKDNLLVALPHVVKGGVVCGDDASHPPVIEAVREVLGPVRLEASLWIWKKA